MRLDKFLKVSRLIKRRTVAKEAGERGWVYLNGRVAKPGDRVRPGDRLTLELGPRRLTVEILNISESAPADRAAELYRVLTDERLT